MSVSTQADVVNYLIIVELTSNYLKKIFYTCSRNFKDGLSYLVVVFAPYYLWNSCMTLFFLFYILHFRVLQFQSAGLTLVDITYVS